MEKSINDDVNTPSLPTKTKMKKPKYLHLQTVLHNIEEVTSGVSENKKKRQKVEVAISEKQIARKPLLQALNEVKMEFREAMSSKKQQMRKDANKCNEGSPIIKKYIKSDASELNRTPTNLKKRKVIGFQETKESPLTPSTKVKKLKKFKLVELDATPDKTKRAKRSKDTMESEEDLLFNRICEEVGSPSTPPKWKSNKRKLEMDTDINMTSDNIVHDLKEHSEELNSNAFKIEFTRVDLQTLVDNIESLLPIKENESMKTQLNKIDWEKVSFNGYSALKCRQTWESILKYQRQLRSTSEILVDVKKWVKELKNSYMNHPDFPKKPLSGYMLYYTEHQSEVLKQNPGTNMVERSRIIADSYKQISEEEKKKYTQLAAQKKALYDAKVEEFFKTHPDFRGYDNGKPPKKPSTPIALYQEHIQSKVRAGKEEEVSKHDLKGRWKLLSDEDRLVWIEKAAEQQINFYNKVKEYQSAHPDYTVSLKHVLTKEEKQLLDKSKGKPDKPPTTAYLLFVNKYVKKHADEMCNMSSKEQKKICSQKWHELPTEKRSKYQTKLDTLCRKFKVENAAYLESLPDYERKLEIKNTPKKLQEDPMEKFTNMAAPVCWDKMPAEEKNEYMSYISKIKKYFDDQHISNQKDNDGEDELSEEEDPNI